MNDNDYPHGGTIVMSDFNSAHAEPVEESKGEETEKMTKEERNRNNGALSFLFQLLIQKQE